MKGCSISRPISLVLDSRKTLSEINTLCCTKGWRWAVSTRFLPYLRRLEYTDCILSTKRTVGWGCRIHRLHLCREVRLLANEYPAYDTKQFVGEAPVMLSTPGRHCPGVVASDRGLSMDQIELYLR